MQKKIIRRSPFKYVYDFQVAWEDTRSVRILLTDSNIEGYNQKENIRNIEYPSIVYE